MHATGKPIPECDLEEYDRSYYERMLAGYRKPIPSSRLRMAWVDRVVRPKQGDRILDLGCAIGTVAHFMASRGAEVTGVDLSPVAIEKARQVWADQDNLTFLRGDASKLDMFEDATFDKVTAADLLEHVPDAVLSDMLGEVRRVLRDGGTLFVYTPNPYHWIELLKAYTPLLKQDPTHIALRGGRAIIRALERHGLRIKQHPFSPSWLPGLRWIEKLAGFVPGLRGLCRYRIVLLAEKRS